MLRIAHFLSHVNERFGGPVRAVIDLSAAMAARGHDLSVLTYDATHVPPDWGQPGKPRAILLPQPRRPASLFSGAQLNVIESHLRSAIPGGADLFHQHGVWDPNLAQLGALARRMRLPYFISVRGMLDDWSMAQRALKKRAYLALAGRHWLERAACVHLTAEAEQTQAKKWFPKGRSVVIPNLPDLAPYRALPGPELARAKFPCLTNGLPTLLFLSRISYKKGAEHLIGAARRMHDRGKPVNVIIAGTAHYPDYMAMLRDRVASARMEEFVHFPGLVVGVEKISLYQACDLFVLPTSQENFGFVFFESLAAGLPLVTTRGVDLWPELERSAGAVIAEPEAGALAETIADLLSDRVRLKAMGVQGRAWCFSFLDPSRILEQFEAMYAMR